MRQQLLKRKKINLPSNLEPFLIEYFSEKYYQIVRIYRASEEGSTKIYSKYLLNDNIQKIEFNNDITVPILNGHVIFSDRGNKLIHKLATEDCRTYVEITIIKTGELINQFNTIFSHIFLVTDFELMSKDNMSTDYRIKLISGYWVKFNNGLNYSSRKDKPYTEMIQDVFRKTEIDFKPINGTPLNILEDHGLYVSATNFKCYDTIEDLLSKVFNNDIGFLLLQYDQIKDEYRLISPKLEFKIEVSELPADNRLNLPTSEMVGNVPRTVNNLSQRNYLDDNMTLDKLKGMDLFYFDHDTRQWKNESYTPNEIFTDLLPLTLDRQTETKFKSISVQMNQNIIQSTNEKLMYDFGFRDHLSKIFLFTDSIEFETYGVLDRKPGDIIELFCPPTHPLYKKYAGTWMITRVYHRIVKKNFVNIIQACRTHQLNETLRMADEGNDSK